MQKEKSDPAYVANGLIEVFIIIIVTYAFDY